MARLKIAEAKRALSEIVDRVAGTKERIVIERDGQDVAAIVPLEDLALLERLEDRRDLDEARRRLADPDDESLAYEEIRRELGLD